jgi:signal transduction histidine kinase
MELALINILSNSVKYSDNKEVLATLSATDEDIYIHISDSGIGIPENELKHVFEPFFRASNTYPYKGYGIGLPLTEKIIRLHGGKILIHSKPQVGTKVSLRFRRQHTLKSSEKKI